jgi:hypothetical protein
LSAQRLLNGCDLKPRRERSKAIFNRDGARNENVGMEYFVKDFEVAKMGKSDQRARVGDDPQSEFSDGFGLGLPFFVSHIEERNAESGSVSDEGNSREAQQFRRLSARHFSLPVQLKDDQLPRGVLHRLVEHLQQAGEFRIERDIDRHR